MFREVEFDEFVNRPICSCGVKMKLVEYNGYYEGFKYWKCESCELDDKMQDMESYTKGKGSYAY